MPGNRRGCIYAKIPGVADVLRLRDFFADINQNRSTFFSVNSHDHICIRKNGSHIALKFCFPFPAYAKEIELVVSLFQDIPRI